MIAEIDFLLPRYSPSNYLIYSDFYDLDFFIVIMLSQIIQVGLISINLIFISYINY